MSDRPLLEVESLSVSFATDAGLVRAVDDVSFSVRPGEALGIVGESGSGKSVSVRTIARVFGLLDRPVIRGRVMFDGTDLLTLREAELQQFRGRRIGMVFQDPMTSLNDALTVGTQIREVLAFHLGMSKSAAHDRAIELLQQVGVPDPDRRVDDYPYQFSGGMRQRVMIAIAIACEPDLIIADEPTTALDMTVQAQVLQILDQLRRDLGLALIVISHDFGVIASTCDRVQVMYAGRVVEHGTLEHVLEYAKHPYTQGLLRVVPRFDDVDHHRYRPIPGQPPRELGSLHGCPFAPRCEHAYDRCTAMPPLFRLGPEHTAACWLVDPNESELVGSTDVNGENG